MSPVESYLADLRTALGDRLPPALAEARLRETRGHLLMAAQDADETEAVRRYGRPRAVANGLVRAEKGYDARSVWWVALPITGTSLLFWQAHGIAVQCLTGGYNLLSSGLIVGLGCATILAFVARVVQTRRWLAGPMITAIVLSRALTIASWHAHPTSYVAGTEHGVWSHRLASPEENARNYARIPDFNTPRGFFREAVYAAPALAFNAALWLAVNVAALGLAALFDRRRVRRV